MAQIIPLSEVRRKLLKARLAALAQSNSPALVETHATTILAMRVLCHDTLAILIDKFGGESRVDYSDVTDIMPVRSDGDVMRVLAERMVPSSVIKFPLH